MLIHGLFMAARPTSYMDLADASAWIIVLFLAYFACYT